LHRRNLCTHNWFDPIHGNPHKNQVKAKKTRPTIRTKGAKNQHRRNRREEKKRMRPKYNLWWDGWCVGVKEWQTNCRLRRSKAQAKWVASLQKTLELHVPSKDPDLFSPKVPPV
jgi:hypothetical protein